MTGSAGKTSTIQYKYFNGRYSPGIVANRASLGFQRIVEVEEESKRKIETIYRQDFPYEGQIHERKVYAHFNNKDTIIQKDRFEYKEIKTYPEQDINAVLLFIHDQFEFESGIEIRHRRRIYHYDEFLGRRPVSFQNVQEFIEIVDGETVHTSYKFNNNASLWLIGRIDQIKIWDSQPWEILDWHRFSYDPNLNKLILHQRLLFDDAEAAICDTFDEGCAREVARGNARWVVVAKNLEYELGNMTYIEDAHSQGTDIDYDQPWQTNPSKITNSLGQSTERIFDFAGRLKRLKNEDGNETIFEIDGLGRTTGVRPAGIGNQKAEEIEYLDLGLLYKQRVRRTLYSSNNSKYIIEYYFDGFGEIYKVSTTTEDGRIWHLKREFFQFHNKVIQFSDPFREHDEFLWNEIRYDGKGRPVAINKVDAVGQITKTQKRYQYNPDGGTTIINSVGNRMIQYFNGYGLPTSITDPLGHQTQYHYDILGRLKQIDLPTNETGASIEYGYDTWGRQRWKIEPSSGRTDYEYDDLDNLTKLTNNLGTSTRFHYDEINRVKGIITPDVVVGYEYDLSSHANSIGKLSRVKSTGPNQLHGKTEFNYDERGNIVSRIEEIGGLPGKYKFLYGYDWQNNLKKRIYPDKTVVGYEYLSDGTLSSISYDGLKLATYGQFNSRRQLGRRETIAGTITELGFNSDGELEKLTTTNSSAKILQDIKYRYDDIGNLTEIIDNRPRKILGGINTDSSQTFSYDALNRLVGANGGYGHLGFSYDAIGNFLSKAGMDYRYYGTGTQNSYIEGRAPVGKLAWRATHNSLGNRIAFEDDRDLDDSFSNWSYSYDSLNRLKEVVSGTQTRIQFIYNHAGERIKKSTLWPDGTILTTYYLGDGYEVRYFSQPNVRLSVTKHIDSIASITKKFTGGGRGLGSYPPGPRIVGNTVKGLQNGRWFHHSTQLGSSEVLTDEKGEEKLRLAYSPYGNLLDNGSIGYDVTTRKFLGHELDEETYLYNFGIRFYDPITGRFLTPDYITPTIGLGAQGFNRFSYVLNNPLSNIDSNGLEPSKPTHTTLDILKSVQEGKSLPNAIKTTLFGGASPKIIKTVLFAIDFFSGEKWVWGNPAGVIGDRAIRQGLILSERGFRAAEFTKTAKWLARFTHPTRPDIIFRPILAERSLGYVVANARLPFQIAGIVPFIGYFQGLAELAAEVGPQLVLFNRIIRDPNVKIFSALSYPETPSQKQARLRMERYRELASRPLTPERIGQIESFLANSVSPVEVGDIIRKPRRREREATVTILEDEVVIE